MLDHAPQRGFVCRVGGGEHRELPESEVAEERVGEPELRVRVINGAGDPLDPIVGPAMRIDIEETHLDRSKRVTTEARAGTHRVELADLWFTEARPLPGLDLFAAAYQCRRVVGGSVVDKDPPVL